MKDKRRLSDHEVPRLAVEVGATPPDVRKGYALPVGIKAFGAMRPNFGEPRAPNTSRELLKLRFTSSNGRQNAHSKRDLD